MLEEFTCNYFGIVLHDLDLSNSYENLPEQHLVAAILNLQKRPPPALNMILLLIHSMVNLCLRASNNESINNGLNPGLTVTQLSLSIRAQSLEGLCQR